MQSRKEDFPLPLALIVLSLTLAFIALGEPLFSGQLQWSVVEKFLDRNSTLLLTSGVLLIFNLSSIVGGIQRWIGFRKQGSRLKSIRGERSLFSRDVLIRFLIGVVAASVTYLVLYVFKIGEVQ